MSRIRLHVLRSGLHWVLFAELCGDRIVKEPMDNEVSWMDAAWVMCGMLFVQEEEAENVGYSLVFAGLAVLPERFWPGRSPSRWR
jgi:hypothetical protein